MKIRDWDSVAEFSLHLAIPDICCRTRVAELRGLCDQFFVVQLCFLHIRIDFVVQDATTSDRINRNCCSHRPDGGRLPNGVTEIVVRIL